MGKVASIDEEVDPWRLLKGFHLMGFDQTVTGGILEGKYVKV